MTKTVAKIKDLGAVTTGKTPDTSNPEFFGGDYPFITPSDYDHKVYYCGSSERTVSDLAKRKHANQFVEKDSVLVTCIGATIGKTCLAPSAALINQQINAIKAYDSYDSKYVYYLMIHNYEKIRNIGLGGGVATPILNKSTFENIEIEVHALPIQRKIAEFLTRHDELIEKNKRQITLLEETARLIYKEWFVHLRFPGYEKVKIKDGVPDGWGKASLKELCDKLDYGFTASATEVPIGPKFLRITDIVPNILDWERVPFCECPENKINNYRLSEGDIVVARTGATTGYAKRIGKLKHEAVFASYLVRMRFSKQISSYITGIYIESDSYKSFVKSNWGGAAQPGANAQTLSRPEILVPALKIQKSFDEIIEPLFQAKENLVFQNTKLEKARDLLLPRLMSGELNL